MTVLLRAGGRYVLQNGIWGQVLVIERERGCCATGMTKDVREVTHIHRYGGMGQETQLGWD